MRSTELRAAGTSLCSARLSEAAGSRGSATGRSGGSGLGRCRSPEDANGGPGGPRSSRCPDETEETRSEDDCGGNPRRIREQTPPVWLSSPGRRSPLLPRGGGSPPRPARREAGRGSRPKAAWAPPGSRLRFPGLGAPRGAGVLHLPGCHVGPVPPQLCSPFQPPKPDTPWGSKHLKPANPVVQPWAFGVILNDAKHCGRGLPGRWAQPPFLGSASAALQELNGGGRALPAGGPQPPDGLMRARVAGAHSSGRFPLLRSASN